MRLYSRPMGMHKSRSTSDLVPVPAGHLSREAETKRKGLMRLLHSSSAGRESTRKPSLIQEVPDSSTIDLIEVEPIVFGSGPTTRANNGGNNVVALTFSENDLKRVLDAARATADARQAGGVVRNLAPEASAVRSRKLSV